MNRLKSLRLPTVLRDYGKLARQAAAEGLDHVRFMARLIELEMPGGLRRQILICGPSPPDPDLRAFARWRESRRIGRRIKAARFPAVKSLDSFDFKAIPALNKMQVLELARGDWVERRGNVALLKACLRHDARGPSGTGKTHIARSLGLSACQKGLSVGFVTSAALAMGLGPVAAPWLTPRTDGGAG